jgi:predicted nucleic acid-binding Zn ribbon protein
MKEIREIIGETLEQEGLAELSKLLRIKEAWKDILDEEAGERTKPYRLDKGRLYIGAESHAWAQETHFRLEQIKKRIKDILGIEISDVIIKKVSF